MRSKHIVYILVVVEILLISTLIYFILPKQEKVVVESDNYTIQDITFVSEQEEVEEEIQEEEYILKQSAWMPPWYFDESFESLKEYVDVLDTVNPVAYGVNKDGSLLDRKGKEYDEFLLFCKENDIRVIPTIGSYDYEVMSSVLNNYEKHIEYILDEMDRYEYDGIDIDYEMIPRDMRDRYIRFLTLLSSELSSRNKVLSVAVFAQWGDDIEYVDHQDTIFVQDLVLIGDIVDEIRVMTYDYTLPSSTTPGPVAPIDWMEDVVEYMITKLPKEKLWLGIHLYGYQWRDGKSNALTQKSLLSIINNQNIQKEFKEDISEVYSEFNCSGSTCTIYYPNQRSISDRRELAKKYGLGGVAYWSIGRDEGVL